MAKNISTGPITADKLYIGPLTVDKVYFGPILVWQNAQALAAPSISVSGSILTITDNSSVAESFNVYVDNILATNVSV